MPFLIYEVRAPFGTVLFTNLEAAKAYQSKCELAAQSILGTILPNQSVGIAPRIVLDACPHNDEVSLAS